MARLDSHSLFRFRHIPSTLTTTNHRHHLHVTKSEVASTDLMSKTLQIHPSLEVLGGGRDKYLPAIVKNLEHPYKRYNPFPVIGWNRHVETIFAAFFRSLPEVKFRRECLRTTDGGTVALDWVAGDHRQLDPLSPILILLVSSINYSLKKITLIS